MVILKSLAIISFSIYFLSLIFFLVGLLKIKSITKKNIGNLTYSIVVAARNEEEDLPKLLDSLVNQTENAEIIVVNDRSSDSTLEILKKYSDIKYINIENIGEGISPKKNALNKGIKKANGDIILLTDADCTASKNWVKSMSKCFNGNVGVVSGLSYLEEDNIMHKIMNLEYFALSICTAGAIGWNFPVISTGNNLAYRKKVFEEVNGFEDILYIDSGDDDLMVQKISQKTDWKFSFAFNSESFIKTKPVKNLKEFIKQRKRWASRGMDYKISVKLPLLFIYIFYLLMLLIPVFALVLPVFSIYLINLLFISVMAEIILLFIGLFKIKKLKYLFLYPFAKIIHIPYIVLMPALGMLRGFEWK